MFFSQLANERGLFNFADVVGAVTDKLVRRHPHVFADTVYASLHEQELAWEQIKREEESEKGRGRATVLDGISLTLPAMSRRSWCRSNLPKSSLRCRAIPTSG